MICIRALAARPLGGLLLLVALYGGACSRSALEAESDESVLSPTTTNTSSYTTTSSSTTSSSTSGGSGGEGACAGRPPCLGGGACMEVPPSGAQPLLHYRFEGDFDNAGALGGYSGVGYGVQWAPGMVGGNAALAAAFTGSGSRIELPGTSAVLSGPELTIALWFREDVYVSDAFPQLLACRGAGRGFESYHGLSTAQCSLTTCWGYGDPQVGPGGCDTFSYSVGPWHHLAYRYQGASTAPGGGADLELLLDGTLVRTLENPSGLPMFAPPIPDLVVGEDSLFRVDDLRVYDYAFEEPELCVEVIGGAWCGGCCVMP